jgi:chloride channel protein, CIC family
MAGPKVARGPALPAKSPANPDETTEMEPPPSSRPGRPINAVAIAFLSVIVGIVAGIMAALFRWLIGFFHNLFFLGTLSVYYDANAHTPAGPWGPFIILAPVLGGLIVVFFVKRFAPEARGHGVPEVMDAIYYNKGIIRPVVVLIKALASALSIGSGGSVGREGPIIQIGSAFGSAVGQWLRVPAWQRVTMIAAGAGSGIAATFNTPIGGILFAAEIMLHEISVRTLVPVALATATATYVGRWFFGANPSFVIPAFQNHEYHLTHPLVLPSFVVMGVLLGFAATLFTKSIYQFEDFFEARIPKNAYLRHSLGMLPVGVIMYGLLVFSGNYHVAGIGYATIQSVLTNSLPALHLLVILFALKLLATALTLGSGGSGGIFSPSLFLGATLGGAYGLLLHKWFPGLPISPPAFAVAGMAGMVGGATGAAITAIVMIFEMTLDYGVIVPMTVTVAVSYGMRKALLNESIYTMKLVRRGHFMPEALQTNFHFMRLARDLKDPNLAVVPADMTLAEFLGNLPKEQPYPCYLAEKDGRLAGIVKPDVILRAVERGRGKESLFEMVSRAYSVVNENSTLFEIIARMRREKVEGFLVSPQTPPLLAKDVQGWISKERIADSSAEAIGLFAD